MKRKITVTICILIVVLLCLQLYRPAIKEQPVTSDINAPANVKAILKRACYDCHSNETNIRWYDQIAPAYWQVAADVNEGRAGLNFSEWDKLAAPDQKAKLWEAVNQINAGAMPLSNYTAVHPSAKLSAEDVAILKAYLKSTVKQPFTDTAKINAADKQFAQWSSGKLQLKNIPVALNGIAFMPDYKNWQALSTTDRYDNGTMRVILGNAIAVKALKEGNIKPWPNGAAFAKVAWASLEDKDGNITPGEFKQVEFMIKDADKYRDTKGWGFARFKTPAMVPYGKTAMFATECVNCHRPQANTDYVFTQPIKH
ncbi:heme-binding domain-containing protein [Mucilaginibacter agri]|uniref:Cytochrome P460 n=1 Tax=Mucilaginibacter agri TaxID=2695265 RepID=A0A965ZIE7_9SPHI|nr:heme-binding domain-containing protein [Mucilaginibacter agri]NCD71674.1 cytochrome P460 [Mucilaginibacter agri]